MGIIPSYLKSNDTIGVVATARKISRKELQAAINLIQQWGFKVKLGKYIFNQHNQFSATDEQRAEDLQCMLDDSEVKAVICARGGYGTVRIIDYINWKQFEEFPKWIIGYSDITVLHSHIYNNYNIATIHAEMPINFPESGADNQATLSLKNILNGWSSNYKWDSFYLNRNGKTESEIIGGNLSVLYSLLGSSSEANWDNKILFIEDLDEYLYHLDRMLTNLKRAGKLKNLKGLVVGGMTDMNDNPIPFGKSAEEIIADAISEYDYPLCFHFPAGHITSNLALILGVEVTLEVSEKGCYLIRK